MGQRRRRRKKPEIDPEEIKAILAVTVTITSAIIQLWRVWRERSRDIDTTRRLNGDVSVDGNGHREPQTQSANLKGKLKMISKIKRGINHVRTSVIKKINRQTEYLLNTTSEQRKANKKMARARKRIKRLDRVRNFRPFNWGLLRKWQERNERKIGTNEVTA